MLHERRRGGGVGGPWAPRGCWRAAPLLLLPLAPPTPSADPRRVIPPNLAARSSPPSPSSFVGRFTAETLPGGWGARRTFLSGGRGGPDTPDEDWAVWAVGEDSEAARTRRPATPRRSGIDATSRFMDLTRPVPSFRRCDTMINGFIRLSTLYYTTIIYTTFFFSFLPPFFSSKRSFRTASELFYISRFSLSIQTGRKSRKLVMAFTTIDYRKSFSVRPYCEKYENGHFISDMQFANRWSWKTDNWSCAVIHSWSLGWSWKTKSSSCVCHIHPSCIFHNFKVTSCINGWVSRGWTPVNL